MNSRQSARSLSPRPWLSQVVLRPLRISCLLCLLPPLGGLPESRGCVGVGPTGLHTCVLLLGLCLLCALWVCHP